MSILQMGTTGSKLRRVLPHIHSLCRLYMRKKILSSERCDEQNQPLPMPFVKSLRKVSKKLSKQLAGSLHVKGRKFKQLNRATERENKLNLRKLKFAEQKNHELLFYLHFQEKINELPDVKTFSAEEMRDFLNEYVCRNDEEIAEIEKQRRPGRPLTSKHQLQLEKRKHDEHIFATGWKTPDLSDEVTVRRLREWNGTSGSVNGWAFTYVTKNPVENESKMEE